MKCISVKSNDIWFLLFLVSGNSSLVLQNLKLDCEFYAYSKFNSTVNYKVEVSPKICQVFA